MKLTIDRDQVTIRILNVHTTHIFILLNYISFTQHSSFFSICFIAIYWYVSHRIFTELKKNQEMHFITMHLVQSCNENRKYKKKKSKNFSGSWRNKSHSYFFFKIVQGQAFDCHEHVQKADGMKLSRSFLVIQFIDVCWLNKTKLKIFQAKYLLD